MRSLTQPEYEWLVAMANGEWEKAEYIYYSSGLPADVLRQRGLYTADTHPDGDGLIRGTFCLTDAGRIAILCYRLINTPGYHE